MVEGAQPYVQGKWAIFIFLFISHSLVMEPFYLLLVHIVDISPKN